jgi:hypothetical protein
MLADWCNEQRVAKRDGHLTNKQIQQLEELPIGYGKLMMNILQGLIK